MQNDLIIVIVVERDGCRGVGRPSYTINSYSVIMGACKFYYFTWMPPLVFIYGVCVRGCVRACVSARVHARRCCAELATVYLSLK